MNKKVLIPIVILLAVIAGAGGFLLAAHNSGNDIFKKVTTTVPYEEKSFDEKVEYLAERNTADDWDKMIALYDEYNLMTDGDKARITNYPTLERTIEGVKGEKRNQVIGEITALSEDLSEENQNIILSLLTKYKSILTNEDIEGYLSYGIHSRVLTDAEKALKKTLKNPKSYKRKKYEIREYAYKIKKKGYEIKVDLSYSAKNSYGKTVSNSRTVYCYYKFEDGKVTLKKSNISTLDKWKMEH